jgi:hypothetical protein
MATGLEISFKTPSPQTTIWAKNVTLSVFRRPSPYDATSLNFPWQLANSRSQYIKKILRKHTYRMCRHRTSGTSDAPLAHQFLKAKCTHLAIKWLISINMRSNRAMLQLNTPQSTDTTDTSAKQPVEARQTNNAMTVINICRRMRLTASTENATGLTLSCYKLT